MKNLKFLLLPFFCLLMAINLVSCDKDDNESNNSLIGTWFGTSTRYEEEKLEITFNSNGSYNLKYYSDYYDDPTDFETSKGTYEILSNTIVKLYETEFNGKAEEDTYSLNYTLQTDGKTLTIGKYASETFVCTRK